MFQTVLDNFKNFAKRAIEIIRKVGISKGKEATGGTLDSLSSAITFVSTDGVQVDVNGSNVFKFIEEGRPPNSKLPPQGSLIESGWMNSRGIPEAAEWPIRVAIARDGIEPVPILETSFSEIIQEYPTSVTNKIGFEISRNLALAAKRGFILPDLNL